MESITLKYDSGAYSKGFTVLAIRGFDEYDEIEFHNSFQNTTDDGVMFENVDSYRRIITIEFDMMTDSAEKAFIVNWLNDRTRTVTFSSVEKSVVLYNEKGYAFEWVDNIKFARKFSLRLKERNTNVTNGAAIGYGGAGQTFNGRAGSAAVTGGSANAITFSSALTTTPIIFCKVFDSAGAIVGDESSITSITSSGFTINPIENGTVKYIAMVAI